MISVLKENYLENRPIEFHDSGFLYICERSDVQISESNGNTNDIHEEIKRRINMGNTRYYSLEKILVPPALQETES